MSIKRFIGRAGVVTVAAGVATMLSTGLAFAHVTANVIGETAAKGGYSKITFRVPNEDETAGTVKLEVKFPAEHPLAGARTKPMPGWTGQVNKVTLDKPVKINNAEVKEAVSSVVWTAAPGTRIGPGEFQEFELSVGPLPDNTDELVMPAIQTYDNGEVVAWDQPVEEGKEEPEHPAPEIVLAAAGSDDHHHGGGTATAETENAAMESGDSAAASTTDDTARWLGGIGLVLGALGVGFGVGATVRSRRPATAKQGGDKS
ncbi:YcnI family protein [Actinophytocola sp.]|uniref:YcnI family copper-binding membrane protein n=1 Tax=Actinophytocola sp. TaxID=1872138 RepID=UPI002D617D69|nr:YcnI family protein [Actinophytocola sp.]HYQ65405.1 YcnI family protein [Actinophytocola sp.]